MMNIIKTIILLSFISIASVSATIITPALPAIETYFRLGLGQLEWLVSIFMVGYVLGQLIYAPLANRYGRIFALRCGFIINLIGIIFCLSAIWAGNYNFLLFGRLITALGASAGLSCTFILINELFAPEQSKQIISYTIIAFTGGIGLAVFIGGLTTQYWHWQGCFWFLFVHAILMLFATNLFPETLKQPKKISPLQLLHGYINALSHSKLICYSIILGLASVIGYIYAALAPVIAQNTLNLSASEYGYWNLINMAAMTLGALCSAKLLKHYSPNKIIFSALIGIFICLGILILFFFSDQKSTLWFFTITAMLYLFSALIFPSASYSASTTIDDRASASSVMNFINMGAATISVIIAGYLPMNSLSVFILIIGVYWLISILNLYFLFTIEKKTAYKIR